MKSVVQSVVIEDEEEEAQFQKVLEDINLELQNPESMIKEEQTTNCLNNYEVSLFWEEKLALILRFLQFYSFLLLIFYEQWPD
mmetsp:Transcript_11575/g.17491  ORF Transcript_11575/g.17491 Transcript_11575/m.17491 type:complete len:83 (+) Transcript_11575:598-846(+)